MKRLWVRDLAPAVAKIGEVTVVTNFGYMGDEKQRKNREHEEK